MGNGKRICGTDAAEPNEAMALPNDGGRTDGWLAAAQQGLRK